MSTVEELIEHVADPNDVHEEPDFIYSEENDQTYSYAAEVFF